MSLHDKQFECDKLTTFWNRTLQQAIIRSGWDSEANYEPIVHHRHIALVDHKFVVVADRVEELDNHSVQRNFNLDFTEVEEERNAVIATSESANLAIYTYPQEEVTLLPGRLSDVNDIARASTRVRFQDTKSSTATYLTVLVPYKGEQKAFADIRLIGDGDNCYRFKCGDSFTVMINEKDMTISKTS